MSGKTRILNHSDSTASSTGGQMKYILITGGVISGIGKGAYNRFVISIYKCSVRTFVDFWIKYNLKFFFDYKGILASSIGSVLKASGIKITSIKIDPYINIDAGTFSPYEHGEVFVLDDGGEVDLDLGMYSNLTRMQTVANHLIIHL